MNIHIKAKNIDLTDTLRTYVHSKIGTIEKVIGASDNLNLFVEIGKESNHHNKAEDLFMAEVRTRVDGKDYFVKNSHADLYAALDTTKDSLLRDVKADKKRGQTLFIRGARSLKKRIKGMKPWWPFGDKEK